MLGSIDDCARELCESSANDLLKSEQPDSKVVSRGERGGVECGGDGC